MKCVKNIRTQEVKKIRDSEAMELVDKKEWVYCPKNEYKKYKVQK